MDTSLLPPKQNNRSRWAPAGANLKRLTARLSPDALWRGALLAGVGLLFVYLAINLLTSWQWMNRPFAGFLHQNRVVTKVDLPGWQARQNKIGAVQIETGDVIMQADGQPVPSSPWLVRYVAQRGVDYPISYVLKNRQGHTIRTVANVDRFTLRNFIQTVAVPTFVAFIVLVIVGATAYLRYRHGQVKLFTLFGLALVCALVSFPEFVTNRFFILNFSLAFLGKIVMPPLLLHFLLLFAYSSRVLKSRPYLLPLIYLPVLPALVHVPILFSHPETTRPFEIIINSYTIIYGLVGVGVLAYLSVWAARDRLQNQAVTLMLGLISLPVLLLTSLIWNADAIDYDLMLNVLEQYGFVGVPIAVAVAVIRYEMFDVARMYRSHFFYLRAIIVALLAYVVLIALLIPTGINLDLFRPRDGVIILLAIGAFFLARFLYRLLYRRWLDYHFYSTIEELRASYRIFSQDLLKVKSRRDLEMLVSWNIPPDFSLEHAELSTRNMPSYSYALQLPLSVGNIQLGTLFLGPKISGAHFTRQELDLFSEIQKQISLVLFSLELDQAIQTIEELTRLKSKFLTSVTHELRTPLNGIINYIGFVIDDYMASLNKEQQEHLQNALQNAEKLEQIINNILDMSKIEARQMALNLQPTDLTEIVDKVTPLVQDLIKDKPVELITELGPDLPNLHGDRLRLRQILVSMLSNAAKFTEAGSIRLSARSNNGNIIIQVADTGIGIDEKTLPTIFQQFTSQGLTDIDQRFGPGLSMPITKSLIEMHGGNLDVETQPGQGTTFTVTLPVNQQEQQIKEGVG